MTQLVSSLIHKSINSWLDKFIHSSPDYDSMYAPIMDNFVYRLGIDLSTAPISGVSMD